MNWLLFISTLILSFLLSYKFIQYISKFKLAEHYSRIDIVFVIVFLATGFWHGAVWNFIFWGLWHGMFIIFEKATGWHKKEGKVIGFFQHIYCILAFVIGWVMFRADNMAYAWLYIKNMFWLIKTHNITYLLPYYVDNIEIIAFCAAFLCAMPIFGRILQIPYQYKVCRTLVNIWLIVLFVVSTSFIAASTYNPFIYFRF